MKSGHRDEGWITGRIYFNRADKRILIKRPNNALSYMEIIYQKNREYGTYFQEESCFALGQEI